MVISGRVAARMRAARYAAFFAPSTATVATGSTNDTTIKFFGQQYLAVLGQPPAGITRSLLA